MEQSNTGVMSLSIKDRGALSAAFMPFLTNGGVFVPTQRNYRLGDNVFILIKLLDDAERIPVACQVAWLTPAGAQGNKAPGVGLQFSDEDAGRTKALIEDLLKGVRGSQPTSTM
ncbi:MAG: PilZ domain-containing protein [Pseudomonadota bacterium]